MAMTGWTPSARRPARAASERQADPRVRACPVSRPPLILFSAKRTRSPTLHPAHPRSRRRQDLRSGSRAGLGRRGSPGQRGSQATMVLPDTPHPEPRLGAGGVCGPSSPWTAPPADPGVRGPPRHTLLVAQGGDLVMHRSPWGHHSPLAPHGAVSAPAPPARSSPHHGSPFSASGRRRPFWGFRAPCPPHAHP